MSLTPVYYAGFDHLPAAYEALFAERSGLTFDQSLPWLRRLASLLAKQGGATTIIGLENNGVPHAALPLAHVAHPGLKLDPDLQGVANYYTAYYSPILSPELEADDVGDSLADAIMRLPHRWQVLDLNPLDVDSKLFATLSSGLRKRGALVEPYFRFGNWYEHVAGRSYDEYHGGRPSQVRETIRRRKRKLEKETACEFQVVTAPEDVDAAMDGYESIYSKSWKQAEPHQDFVRDIAKQFAAAGWLRLGMLRVEGRPAASQLWFVFAGTASIFKLAYDPDFQSYSVGSLLTSHLMNHVITHDRVHTIDYLCGDDSYKKDWMSNRRERWGLRVYRLASVRGMAGALRSLAGRVTRKWRHRAAESPAASASTLSANTGSPTRLTTR